LIRLARADDAERIAELYSPYVTRHATSFELVPPDTAAMADRIDKVQQRWPWLVWADEHGVQAYAYASAYAERVCYQWSVTVSVYVADTCKRGGVGRALYGRLFEVLLRQGAYNAFAGITLPNDASVGLHRAMGFEPVGVYPRAGFKLGAWHDVAWMGRALRQPAPGEAPAEPRALPDLLAAGELADLGLLPGR
jgi:phosphinothricin acetyltransferase